MGVALHPVKVWLIYQIAEESLAINELFLDNHEGDLNRGSIILYPSSIVRKLSREERSHSSSMLDT